MKRAFVVGATGLTGRFVVAELCARGMAVTAHVRPDSSRLEEWRTHFEGLGATVDTTPWEKGAMMQRFENEVPDLVFLLLGTTKKRARRGGGDYEEVDYGMTVMAIDALCQRGETGVVYLSSLGVKDGVRSAYMLARWRVEEHLRASGLAYLIARPSFIVGDRDEPRMMEHVGSAVADGVFWSVGLFGAKKSRNRLSSIRGEDLANGLVREAIDAELTGRIVYSDDLR